jgi:hypothetical protein
MPASKDHRWLIYQSLDCLATRRAGLSRIYGGDFRTIKHLWDWLKPLSPHSAVADANSRWNRAQSDLRHTIMPERSFGIQRCAPLNKLLISLVGPAGLEPATRPL